MANPMVRSLYTSAHMEEDIYITFYPVYGCQHIKGQFRVIFIANPMVRSNLIQKYAILALVDEFQHVVSELKIFLLFLTQKQVSPHFSSALALVSSW